jgi:hypothetical protein
MREIIAAPFERAHEIIAAFSKKTKKREFS